MSSSQIVKGILSENEKELLDACLHKSVEEVKVLLDKSDVRIDCLDEHGSTPLNQAAFKGNLEICKLLIERGANVNTIEHEHGYTPLMFAALSGNADLCRFLLQKGARPDRRNKVDRTATEMAAFTGQHHCVSAINNYVDFEQVAYYAKPHGDEKEARIHENLVPILHTLTLTYNVHPVKIILYICENIELIEYEKPIVYILEDLMERHIKCKETNEVKMKIYVMAFKIHMILSTFRACFKFLQSIKSDTKKTDKEKLISYAKRNLGRKIWFLVISFFLLIKIFDYGSICGLPSFASLLSCKDEPYPKMLELFVRQSIKEYPYRQSVLFKQLIQTLSKTKVGDNPSAVSCVHQLLLGQRMMADEFFCATCGESRASKRCAACKMANYCNSECQKLHWFTHKKWCSKLAEDFKKMYVTRENKTEAVINGDFEKTLDNLKLETSHEEKKVES